MKRQLITWIGLCFCSVGTLFVLITIDDNRDNLKNARAIVEKAHPSFVIESGPEEIGFSKVRIIRHIETGKRFIFTEKGSAATVTPLN